LIYTNYPYEVNNISRLIHKWNWTRYLIYVRISNQGTQNVAIMVRLSNFYDTAIFHFTSYDDMSVVTYQHWGLYHILVRCTSRWWLL